MAAGGGGGIGWEAIKRVGTRKLSNELLYVG